MRHAFAIARRELRSFFVSPIAYVVVTIFAFLSGAFFSNMLVYYVKQSTIADRQIALVGRSDFQLDVPTMFLGEFFKNESFILLLVLPLLTMGLITDERRKGTLELLLTSPLRPGELVAGKFLGAMAFLSVMLAPTVPLFVFLALGGAWEPGVVLASYIGLLALGGAQIALGLFVSSLCENILISAFGTYGVLLILHFVDTSATIARSIWVDFINFFSFNFHYLNFTRGVLSLGDVIYFATYMALGLFLTQRSIEAIRFKRS
ncbi:MAG: ABC transporter permease subunit [Acidobacteria bacterium]|nr:ABC transporter permease subunit [Acidobacteriota bacterium]